MFNSLLSFIFLLTVSTVFCTEDKYIYVDSQTANTLLEKFPELATLMSRGAEIDILKVKEEDKEVIASKLHAITGKCGNFTDEGANPEEAIQNLQQLEDRVELAQKLFQFNILNFPDISRQAEVNPLLEKVNEASIRFYIDQLASYPTRFYQSAYSYLAVERLSRIWKYLIRNRNDATVELIGHRWKQPSLALTIKGKSNRRLIMGGHIDSINGGQGSQNSGNNEHAPGADDDASGVSTMTEIIRILMEANYIPENTLVFYAYAAEEIGLLGSDYIAGLNKSNNSQIIAVLQLDMTNYKGSSKAIYFDSTSSNADPALNQYLGTLIDEYVKEPWGNMSCGYACSDHNSWFKRGYPASFPFEAAGIGSSNPQIHTSQDRLSVTNNSASHSVHFAKLGISYVLELDRP
jgi:leucyl aminopeptidase